jgi:O-antigen/teichoic acid export membrane protein
MAKWLKIVFLVHMVVAVVLGALFLIIPGRFLSWLGWAPVDPLLTRVLGAALLALGWGSFRGWRAQERAQVAVLIEVEAAFTILGAVGLLRHLLIAHYPWMVWLLFAGLAAFAVAWVVAWVKK